MLILDYQSIEKFLSDLVQNQTVWIDPTTVNWKLRIIVGSQAIEKTSPITLPKSLKNDTEIEGIRRCHIRDGVALTAFLHWLERKVQAEPNSFTEYQVTEKIEEFRSKMAMHVGPSFATIAGYESNGAIIHYKPEQATAKTLGTDSMFLLDSGAQYKDGTTDVTR